MRSLFILVLFAISRNVPQTHAVSQCRDFDNRTFSVDYGRMRGVWYPVLTSNEAETRNCGRIKITKVTTFLNYEILLENGVRILRQLYPHGKRALVNTEKDAVAYILSTDYQSFHISYYCSVDVTNNKASYKEWFTIYGKPPHLLEIQNSSIYGKVIDNIAGEGISLELIEQIKCNVKEPSKSGCIKFEEEDLIAADFEKFAGNWTLRTTNNADSRYLYSYSLATYIENQFEVSRYLGYQLIGKGNFAHRNGSRVLSRQLNYEDGLSSILYNDDSYRIIYLCDQRYIEDRRAEDQTFTGVLRISARNTVPFNLADVMEIVFTKLKPRVLGLIVDLIFSSEILNDDLVSIAAHGKQFDDKDLAEVNFAFQNGVTFKLRYSTEKLKLFDKSIGQLNGESLIISRTNGTQIVKNITEYHVPGFKRIYRIVNGKYSEVAYLYADSDFMLQYEFCSSPTGKENLRFYAREGVNNYEENYIRILNLLSSSITSKISDLLQKLPHPEPTRSKYQINFDENDIIDTDFVKDNGVWNLRYYTNAAYIFNYLNSTAVSTNKKQGFISFERNSIEYNVSRISGTRVLKLVELESGDSLLVVSLYNDYVNAKVNYVFNGTFHTLIVLARDGIDLDNHALHSILSKIKPSTLALIDALVKSLVSVTKKVKPLFDGINFNETELIDTDFTNDSGLWILRYTSSDAYKYVYLNSTAQSKDRKQGFFYNDGTVTEYNISKISGTRVLKLEFESGGGLMVASLYNDYVNFKVNYVFNATTRGLIIFARDSIDLENDAHLDLLAKIDPIALSRVTSHALQLFPINVPNYVSSCRKLSERYVVNVNLSQDSGVWRLRLSSKTDTRYIFDKSISVITANHLLGVNYYHDKELDYYGAEKLPNTGILFTKSYLNGDGRLIQLYNDYDKYKIVYQCDKNGEILQFLVRNGSENDIAKYFEIYSRLNSTAISIFEPLLQQLTPVFKPIYLPQCRQLDESNIIDVDFTRNTGLWQLRLMSKYDNKYLYNNSLYETDGENMQSTYSFGKEIVSRNKESHIHGSHVILVDSTRTGEARNIYLYNDYTSYSVVYTCDANGEIVRLLSRDNVAHNEEDYNAIIEAIDQAVRDKFVDLLDALKPAKPYKRDCRKFLEEELVDVNFAVMTGKWDLRLSTSQSKEKPYNSTNFEIDANTLLTTRYLGNQPKSHASQYKVENSNLVARLYNGVTSWLSYLYQDENYLVSYECNELRSKKEIEAIEFLRLYSRSSIPDNYRNYLQVITQINPSAIKKIKDLIKEFKRLNKVKLSYDDICPTLKNAMKNVDLNQLSGKWDLVMTSNPKWDHDCSYSIAKVQNTNNRSATHIINSYLFPGKISESTNSSLFKTSTQYKEYDSWILATDYKTYLLSYYCQNNVVFGQNHKSELLRLSTRGIEISQLDSKTLHQLQEVAASIGYRLTPIIGDHRCVQTNSSKISDEKKVDLDISTCDKQCGELESIASQLDFTKFEGVWHVIYQSIPFASDECIQFVNVLYNNESIHYSLRNGSNLIEGDLRAADTNKTRFIDNYSNNWLLFENNFNYLLLQICNKNSTPFDNDISNSIFIVLSRDVHISSDTLERITNKLTQLSLNVNKLFKSLCHSSYLTDIPLFNSLNSQNLVQLSRGRDENTMIAVDFAKLTGHWNAVMTKTKGFRCFALDFEQLNATSPAFNATILVDTKVFEEFTLSPNNQTNTTGVVLHRYIHRKQGVQTISWFILDTDYHNYLVVYQEVNNKSSDDYWTIYSRPAKTLTNLQLEYAKIKLDAFGVTRDSDANFLHSVKHQNC